MEVSDAGIEKKTKGKRKRNIIFNAAKHGMVRDAAAGGTPPFSTGVGANRWRRGGDFV